MPTLFNNLLAATIVSTASLSSENAIQQNPAVVPQVGHPPPPTADQTIVGLLRELRLSGNTYSPLRPSLPIALSESFLNEHSDRSHWHFDKKIQEIVNLGPDAIVPILACIDLEDTTDIQLPGKSLRQYRDSVRHFGSEREQLTAARLLFDAPGDAGHGSRSLGDRVNKDRLTVGDVCFELLGGITNRRYSVVAYQPTSAALVVSPISDHRIAAYLREVWGHQQGGLGLYESLLADSGQRSDWDMAAGGVIRLVKYYPDRALRPLEEFVRDSRPKAKDDVEVHRRLSAVMRYVSQSSDVRIRDAVCQFAEDEGDPGLYLAAFGCRQLSSTNVDEKSWQRLRSSLRSALREYNEIDADRSLRVALGTPLAPVDSILDCYLEGNTAHRGRRLIQLILAPAPESAWVNCALFKLLASKTPYSDNNLGDDSGPQVRHLAAARLGQSLGLGQIEVQTLQNEQEFARLIEQIKAIAGPSGLCARR